jgi:hypothetical protein
MLSTQFPGLPVHSNDVSLLSVAVGRLLMDDPLPFTFRDRLADLEDRLESPADRVAGLLVAIEMANFDRDNEYSRRHLAEFLANFDTYLAKAREKLLHLTTSTAIASFTSCDWLDHMEAAIAAGAGFLSYPPTFKGGYERQYRSLEAWIEWEPPDYRLYDPAQLDTVLARLEQSGIPYCIGTDQAFDHREPIALFEQGRHRAFYAYARVERSSVRQRFTRGVPFEYTPCDPSKLTGRSQIQVTRAEQKHLNFLKDCYLSKAVGAHSMGTDGFLVWLDGELAGSIIYQPSKFDPDGIYLLSDLSLSREARLSKLIAMVATSRTLIRHLEVKAMKRYTSIATTAFSKNPASMKYRGVFELTKRTPTDNGFMLQYESEVRSQTPAKLYSQWFKKHGSKARH